MAIVIVVVIITASIALTKQDEADRDKVLAEQGLQQCLEKVGGYAPRTIWKKECND